MNSVKLTNGAVSLVDGPVLQDRYSATGVDVPHPKGKLSCHYHGVRLISWHATNNLLTGQFVLGSNMTQPVM